jgi:hypothetical protein
MIHHARQSVTIAFIVFGVAPAIGAGEIHIKYGPDAPEKMAAENVAYYEGMLNLDRNHPAAFEHDHPFFAKMFVDPTRLNKLINRWEADEQRFEYWHNSLWKVLDGYVLTHENQIPPPVILPPPGGNSGVGSSGGGGNGGSLGAQSLPEPSTLALWISGLLVGLGRLSWQRASRSPVRHVP